MRRLTSLALALAVPALALVAALAPPLRAEEPVDWEMVTKIRQEGLRNSQVMDLLEHMTEEIGPRLTGSPGMQAASAWTKEKFEEWGFENVRLEPFEFGRGWSYERTSVHLIEPREMPLSALPEAWTPGTDGPVRGPALKVSFESPEDLEKYRGKLAGKILFVSDIREMEESDEPYVQRLSPEELAELEAFDIPGLRGGRGGFDRSNPRFQRFLRRARMREQLNEFLAEEGVLATVEISSRDGGLLRVGGGGSREPDENPGVTGLVMAAEQYNWLARRLEKAEKAWREERAAARKAAEAEAEHEGTNGDATHDDATNGDHGTDGAADEGADAGEAAGAQPEAPDGMMKRRDREKAEDFEVPDSLGVVLEIDVAARFHDDDLDSYNTLADLPGTGDGLVMAGAHLDSWHTGTGATDNGAGCVVVMEAMRILKALGVEPKRTIRAALWSGEEQGLIGSRHHVEQNFAKLPVKEGQEDVPRFLREYEGDIETKPAHDTFSAYFNLDNGSGKIRGVYTQENLGVAPIFAAWLEPFHDLGADTITHRNTGGTDHLAFDSVGLPGFQFIQDELDYRSRTHHTHADTLDHAVREDLMQASVVMASFLYHAAMRDEPLPRKPMPSFDSDDGDD